MIFLANDKSGSRYRLFAFAKASALPASFALALASGLSGCASPGIPRPPALHLPATVTDLSARRIGDRVQLQWTAPDRTTDGLDLTTPTTVEVCRDPASTAAATPLAPAPGQTLPCTPVITMAGHRGPSTAIDQLPPLLTNSTAARPLIGYRIRILNQRGRSASPSSVALVPSGPPPPPVDKFRATQTKEGVVLEWQKKPSVPGSTELPATVEVLRTIETPLTGSADAQGAVPALAVRTAKKPAINPFSKAGSGNGTSEVHLRQNLAPSRSPATANPQGSSQAQILDGMVDRTALQSMTYTYTAQRVSIITVGQKTMEVRSELAAPVTIVRRDTFPPDPPTGLVSIPGTATPSSGEAARHGAIDLAWEPNTETDLAGYIVYRADLAEGAPGAVKPVRLTASPIPGSTYHDATPLTGHRYLYRVTAIDRNGNESAFSISVEDAPDSH